MRFGLKSFFTLFVAKALWVCCFAKCLSFSFFLFPLHLKQWHHNSKKELQQSNQKSTVTHICNVLMSY